MKEYEIVAVDLVDHAFQYADLSMWAEHRELKAMWCKQALVMLACADLLREVSDLRAFGGYTSEAYRVLFREV